MGPVPLCTTLVPTTLRGHGASAHGCHILAWKGSNKHGVTRMVNCKSGIQSGIQADSAHKKLSRLTKFPHRVTGQNKDSTTFRQPEGPVRTRASCNAYRIDYIYKLCRLETVKSPPKHTSLQIWPAESSQQPWVGLCWKWCFHSEDAKTSTKNMDRHAHYEIMIMAELWAQPLAE